MPAAAAQRRPLVSAVVLNWNGGASVLRCLDDLAAQTYAPLEIAVVDNGSADGSAEAIESRFPGALRVRNAANLGFAAGMNRGIDAARGAILVLLNQDVRLDPTFVERAVRAFEAAPAEIGMLAARILKLAGSEKTDRPLGGGILVRRRIQLAIDPALATAHATFGPTWCCPVLRRTLIEDVTRVAGQFFDETYFAYGEDLDVNLRAQLRGWRCAYDPGLVAWHAQSGASGGAIRLWDKPPWLRIHALRNRYSTIVKDLPFAVLWRIAPALALAELAVWPYFLWHGPSTLPCLVRAHAEVLRRLPMLLRQRRRIQSARQVPPRHLLRFLVGI